MKTKQQTMASTAWSASQLEPRLSQEDISGMATFTFSTVLQPPPGSNISSIDIDLKINDNSNKNNDGDGANPPVLNDALSIRRIVFVDEQGCSPEGELDSDDARSWHWVMYASPSSSSSSPSDFNRGSDSCQIPVAVIRLVPPPHAPHPHPHSSSTSSSSFCDPAGAGERISASGPGEDGLSVKEPPPQQQEEEPYIKLGRIAVLPSYRGRGLSRLLLQTVENWALSHADEINGNSANNSHQNKKNTNNAPWKGLILIHSQVQVQSLYERFGYRVDESMGMWYEEGMCHVAMWKRLID